MTAVLLEGVDLTGKTTLARALAGEHGHVVHSGPPSGPAIAEYIKPMLDYDPRHDTIILDRGHVGELVWPQIFDRESDFTPSQFAYMELFMMSRGTTYVLCQRDFTDLSAALQDSDEPIDERQAYDANDAFIETLTEMCASPVITYNFGRGQVEDQMDGIASVAEASAEFVSPIFNITPRYVGSPRPRALLVGEQCNGDDGLAWNGLPFVPMPGTSGEFMLDELVDADAWENIGLVNALDLDGKPEAIRDLWNLLGRPAVVALGKKAEKVLKKQGVPHGAAPHPSYVKRFKRGEGRFYLATLIAFAAATTTLEGAAYANDRS